MPQRRPVSRSLRARNAEFRVVTGSVVDVLRCARVWVACMHICMYVHIQHHHPFRCHSSCSSVEQANGSLMVTSSGPTTSQAGLAQPSVPPWASLASGAASGLASCLLLQPMDLLKTRMQQQQQHDRDEHRRRGGPRKRTERLVSMARQVVRQDGWPGLWRGTGPTVAR